MTTTTEAKPDTRFFPGYIWVSDHPDGKLGLCVKADCRYDAAQTYLRSQMQYWNKGRTFTAYAWNNATDTPLQVDIDW